MRICASAKEAAEGADILCTLTPSKTPVLEREWLKPGAHVNAVGACSADARELTGELVRDSVFYCDSVESVMAESGDFLIPLREGLFGEEHLRGTLGELLLGRKPDAPPLRRSPSMNRWGWQWRTSPVPKPSAVPPRNCNRQSRKT